MKKISAGLLVLLSVFSRLSAATYPAPLSLAVPNPEPALPSGFDTFNPPVDSSQPPAGAPAFAEWTRFGSGGDSLAVAVDGASTFQVYGQTSASNGSLQTPAILGQNTTSAQLGLNAALPANSMLLLWAANASGFSAPVAINKTELWWVGPDTAPAGGSSSAYGRNLAYGGITPVVYIQPASGVGVFATVTGFTPGKVDFTVPSLANGSYQVWVHNGHGGHYGWGGPQTLNIQPGMTFGATFNVKNYGAKGDGSSDDSAAIQSAMAAAGSAGGVLYFPAGTYIMNQMLTPPSHIQIKGDGKDISTILLGSSFSNLAMIFNDQPGQSSFLELRDLTLGANGHYGNSSINALVRLRSQSNIHFINMKIVSDDKQQFDTLGADHVVMQGCDFVGSGCYLGNARQVIVDHCNFYGEYQNNAVAICTLQSGGQVSLTNNTGQSYSASNPAAGRFFYLVGGQGSWSNLYIGNNTTYNLAPSPSKSDQNAGEQILWESDNSVYTGRANTGGANTITLPSSGGWGGGAYSVVIESGKGMGQYRRVVADNGAGTLTLDQPWNVAPDSSSLAVVLCLFNHGYCYGNSLQGMADYATRYTASAGFEPYSGVADLVIDNNTISQCRSGIANFSIMDKAAGVQPEYWIQAMHNNISSCLWAVLTQYSQGSGSSAQSACAIFGSTYSYNLFNNVASATFPVNVYDSVASPGTIGLTTLDHNCGTYLAAGLSVGTGGVYGTLSTGNTFNAGAGSCALTPTVPPASPTPAGSPTRTPTFSASPTQSQTWTITPTFSATPTSTPTPTPTATLPCPWSHQDVGAVGPAGSTGLSRSTFTVQASGSDIYGAQDSFHFAYQPVQGDVTITARVLSLANTNAAAKAGVMLRQDLSAGSAGALTDMLAGDGEVEFVRRLSAGTASTAFAIAGGTPVWVRLVKIGGTVTSYASPDGLAWQAVGTDQVALTGTFYAGLAVCSHANTVLTSAVFDQVQIKADGLVDCAHITPGKTPAIVVASQTASPTPTPTATVSWSSTATVSSTPTPTDSTTASPTATPSLTVTPPASPTGTATPSLVASSTATSTPTPSPSGTSTPSPTGTAPAPAGTPAQTPSPADPPAGSSTPSPTGTAVVLDTSGKAQILSAWVAPSPVFGGTAFVRVALAGLVDSVQVAVYTPAYNQVDSQSFRASDGSQSLVLNTSSWPRGVLFVSVQAMGPAGSDKRVVPTYKVQ